MPTELTWLGHGTWSIETAGKTILVDPFLDDSPAAPIKADEARADYILVSHGHGDHVSDAAKIAQRTGALVISNYEICEWLTRQGVQRTHPHNLGGGSKQEFGRVKLTLAHHSSMLPDGSYGGNPSGFLLTLTNGIVYLACDTGLFYDMKLIGSVGIDLAILPIGDQFTMGPEDSIRAIQLIEPKRVAPSHYNTWPPIRQDVQDWARKVRQQTTSEPLLVAPGGKISL